MKINNSINLHKTANEEGQDRTNNSNTNELCNLHEKEVTARGIVHWICQQIPEELEEVRKLSPVEIGQQNSSVHRIKPPNALHSLYTQIISYTKEMQRESSKIRAVKVNSF